MSSRHRRLIVLILGICCFGISATAFAGHRDAAPLSAKALSKLTQEFAAPVSPGLVEALNKELDDMAHVAEPIPKRKGKPLKGAQLKSASEAQRMLIAGKRHELGVLHAQVQSEFAATRAKLARLGLKKQVRDWDALAGQVEQRFGRVDDALSASDTPDDAERERGLGRLRTELKALRGDSATRQFEIGPLPGPTIHQGIPPAGRQQRPSKNTPQYLSSRRPVGYNMFASLGPIQLAAAPQTPPEAASCGYTSADLAATPDAPQSVEIQQLAEQLGYSPASIFEYVANHIEFQPYYGGLKGAQATLLSKSGGPTDQASLLIALLRASNIPARYVRGTVAVTDPVADPNGGRVARWVGAKSYQGAASILAQGLFGAGTYSFNGSVVGVQMNHVWVEACVPYGRYRGAAVDNTGERWIPLDPSFKDKTYQAGISTGVSFDYTGYLAARTNGPDSLPEEAFAQQAQTAARVTDPNAALRDIPYKGTIRKLTVDILPASLPYDVVAFTNWPGTTSPEIAQLPSQHRYRLAVGGLGLASAYNLYLPDISLSRVTLAFKGATAGDQTALDAWHTDNNLASAIPCTINVQPVLRVDGVDQGVSGGTVGLCTTTNPLTLGVYLDEYSAGALNAVSYNNIGAANIHALQAYAFQASDAVLAGRAATLIANVNATANPNATAVTLDKTEGAYLDLIGLKYMRYVSDATKEVAGIDGGSGASGNHLGLSSSQMKVQYLFDLPYAVNRTGFLVDMPGMLSRDVDLSTGNTNWNTFRLAGYAGSAYESYVWQENSRLDSVSTVRGLQFSAETGIGNVTVNSANWATIRPQLSVYPGATADDCTYNPATLEYPRCAIDSTTTGILAFVNKGYTVTLPKSLIQYGDWKGIVYVDEHQATGGTDTTCGAAGRSCAGFIISKYAGGYTVGTQTPTTSNTTLNTGITTQPEVPVVLQAPSNPANLQNSTTLTNGSSSLITTAGDPVNMATGNMYHTERDLMIKGRGGFPIVFERSYNSRSPADGPLGFGWTHSFNHSLKFYGVEGGTAKVSWIDGTGAEKFFSTTNHTNGDIAVNSTIPDPAGIFVTFQRQADGTYTIREKNGLTYRFQSVAGPAGVPGTATPVIARLLSITDRNGNALTLSYSAITGCAGGTLLCQVTDALGRSLIFTYTGSHLSQIQDFTGRQYQYGYDADGNLSSFKNPLAVAGTQNPVAYSYYTAIDGVSLAHLMKQYKLPRGNGMRFEYYDNGRTFRHTVVNIDGTLSPDQVNTFVYNDFRREAIQTNERGYERQFFFDANGNPLKIVEENGAEHVYEYTQAGQPFSRTAKTDPLGMRSQYAYDANGNVTQITTPRGATVNYYDFTAFSQPRRIQDARGNWTILRYDAKGNVTDVIHTVAGYIPSACSGECAFPAAGQIVAWVVNGYDSAGNLTSTKRVRDFAAQLAANTPTSDTGPLNTFAYDANQLNATTVARRGIQNSDTLPSTQSATLSYDGLGRLKTGVDADWYPTAFSYDAVDRITQATDRLGKLRDYQFDANGNSVGQFLELPVNGVNTLVDSSSARYDDSDRLLANMDSGGYVTAYSYDAAGDVTRTTNPDNYSLTFDYDEANRVIHAYDQEYNEVYLSRDATGRVRATTDPNGNTVANTYWDASRDGRLKSTTWPVIQSYTTGRSVQYDYDAGGNVTTVTEIPAGGSGLANRVTTTGYDELNRPVRIVGPQYTDAAYGLVCPVTRYTYDSLGRRTQVAAGYTPSPCATAASDVTTVQETRAYDDFGRQIQVTDALGRFWTTTYDANNNPVTTVDAKGQTTTFTWDIGHQLLTRTEQGGRLTRYTRNALGQVTAASHPEASYTYGYDYVHRLTTVTDSRGNKALTYDWSPGGWLNSLSDSEGHVTTYLYDPEGRLAAITAPNNDTVTFRFDAGGRLTEKMLPNGVSARYQYNADNSVSQIVNRTGTGILSQHDYTYDGVGDRATQAENIGGTTVNYAYSYDELKRLTQVSNGTAAQQEDYSYDPLNNRTLESIGNPVASTQAYVYDAANELKEIHSGTTTGPLLASLSYDNNGNLQSDGTRTYTWDAIDQLSQVTNGATTVTYGYDSEGQRIRKTVNGATTQWLYDGDNVYAEYGAGWSAALALYTEAGTDYPILRANLTGGAFGQAQYYHTDGLGSVVGVSNSTDTTTQTQRFDAWGNKLSGTIPQSAQFGYTGREPDETGLVYYRARYYNPGIGRFV